MMIQSPSASAVRMTIDTAPRGLLVVALAYVTLICLVAALAVSARTGLFHDATPQISPPTGDAWAPARSYVV